MNAPARALAVCAVLAVATFGEGGAAPLSLLVAHLLIALFVAVFYFTSTASHETARAPSRVWLVFLVLAGASALAAPYAYAAWLVLVEFLAFTSLVWLVAGEPTATARLLGPALAVLVTVHGIVAIAQRLGGNPRPASTFFNPNHLAAWLAGVSVFLIGRAFGEEGSRRARFVAAAAVVPALIGIFVSGSRGAILGLMAGAAVLYAFLPVSRSWRARRGLYVTMALLIAVALLGVATRFRSDADPYRYHRTRIWVSSGSAILESPWLGLGPGQFSAAAPNLSFPLESAPLRYARGFGSPHSDVLRIACEFGIPAAIAGLVAVALAIGPLVRKRRDVSGTEGAALAALSALFAQGCVDDLTARPALTMAGAAFCGLIVARRREERVNRPSWIAPAVAAILVAFALGPGELAGFIAWTSLQRVPPGRLDQPGLLRLRRAIDWNPYHPAGWERLAEHFVGDGKTWTIDDYANAREAAEHAQRLSPVDTVYARNLARIEATACLTILPFEATRERAAQWYAEASRFARNDASIPLEASKFLIQAGDPAGSRRAALQALAIEPKAATPRLWLARAMLQEEGFWAVAKARGLLEEALALSHGSGEPIASSYDTALRGLDPNDVRALRRDIAAEEAR